MRLGQSQTGLSLYPTVVTPPPAPPPAVPGPFVPVDLSDARPLPSREALSFTFQRDLSLYAPVAPPTQSLVWNPGIRIRIGGYASMQSLASMKAATDSIFAADINHNIKGVCLSPTWRQLEGDTLGDYSAGFTAIGAMINLMKSYNPPRDVTIEVNGGGNGWTAQSSAPNNFCPLYMQNATYGGGMTWQGLDRPYIVIWNINVVNRLIALFAAYNNHFGPDTPTGGIYRWDPFQEFSINAAAAGYSTQNVVNIWPALMSGMRSAAPNTLIMVKPTYFNLSDTQGTQYATMMSASLANRISWGTEDTADSRQDQGQRAFIGGYTASPTNHAAARDWDYHCNVDPAELWRTSGSSITVPPATYGSGRMYDAVGNVGIWTKVKAMASSHVDIYVDGFGSCPNVNRRSAAAGTVGVDYSANPSPGPGAGSGASHPNIIDVLTENTTYSGVIPGALAVNTVYPYSS